MPNGSTSSKTINPSTVPVATLLSRLAESEAARKKFDSTWDGNWADYNSNQWLGINKIAWFQSEPVFNKTFEFVEINRAMLADQKWGIDAIPSSMKLVGGKNPRDMADKANKLLDWLWDELELQSKLAELSLHLFLKGTGLLKASFDPSDISDQAVGQINIDVVDPKYIFPDPDATCVEDAAFIFEKRPVSMRYIQRRWPDKIAEIKLKGGGSSYELAPAGTELSRVSAADEGNRIDLVECFYHDETIELLSETEDTVTTKKSYPTGRYTLMTSNGVVLEDKPNPYTKFPYIRFVEIPMPGSFWGGCSVDKGSSIQKNKALEWLIERVEIVDPDGTVIDRTALEPPESASDQSDETTAETTSEPSDELASQAANEDAQ